MKYLVVIPARYYSSRLPGKPLINIKGLPMIVRTYKRCAKVFDKNKIFVATDDNRISKVCNNFNINFVLTSKKCLTGTDRIAEVAKKIKADNYINVQGDEPFIASKDLLLLLKSVKKFPNKILNGYTEIKNYKDFISTSIPKVVMRENSKLLYMSRSPIPISMNKKFKKAWKQVCIYSFPRKALLKFSKRKRKTLLENIEDIEILRFLEMGYEIELVKMSGKSFSIDTKDDLKKIF